VAKTGLSGHASIAIDIGGTFTDVVLIHGDRSFAEKTLTTPHDLLEGFFEGVTRILAKAGLQASDIDGRIVHATTTVTNALIERRGERSAMLFTEGFADILRIRREDRFDIYDTQIEAPPPIIEQTYSIAERAYADGTIETVPADADIDALAVALEERAIGSLGICFLHSYINPANEQVVTRRLQTLLPNLHISMSSEVSPQIREYVRASTTAVNAYAVSVSKPYLDRLETSLATRGFVLRPLMVLSSGGLAAIGTAARFPVRMIESGPAAGALAAAFFARALQLGDVLGFDMGGTTAKVCLIQNYEPLVAAEFEVDRTYRLKEGSGYPVNVPTIDLIEIGAGGGSIADVNDMGLLRVGPHSAGASPGPACYGRGGTNATVTDAAIHLGLLDPDNFLGGDMLLDATAAEKALEAVGRKLGFNSIEVARGVHDIVCEAMAGAVRAHAAERGVDYRGVPLLAFGGSGPVFACQVADLLGSHKVIFPPLASVFSAFGALVMPVRFDLSRSVIMRLGAMDWQLVDEVLDQLEAEGRETLKMAGIRAQDVILEFSADMRYLGQHYEIPVSFSERPAPSASLRAIFEDEVLRRRSVRQESLDVEIVNWRVAASGPIEPGPEFCHAREGRGRAKVRTVYAWGDHQAKIVRRDCLSPDSTMKGPLLIEESGTTLVIPPGWTVHAGSQGCIITERDERPISAAPNTDVMDLRKRGQSAHIDSPAQIMISRNKRRITV
jgi:N-methylhydantoinase A